MEVLETELGVRKKINKVNRQGTMEKGLIAVGMKTLEAKQDVMEKKYKLGTKKIY